MTRFEIDAFLDRVERRAEGAAWMQRLMHFAHAVTEDRVLQLSTAVAVASLWLALAFGDYRFLVPLLAAAVVTIRRFRGLEGDVVPDDDDWL